MGIAGWQGAIGGTGTTAELDCAHVDLDRMGVPRCEGQLVLSISARIGWLAARRPLTFEHVSATNVSRTRRWHPGFPDDPWSLADWSNAMCGEAGEVANVVKKLRRHEFGHNGVLDGDVDELNEQLADELADVFLYLDLLATRAGVDLPRAIRRKFNVVSERQGFPERL